MIEDNSGKGNSRSKGQVTEARGHGVGGRIEKVTKQLRQTHMGRPANTEQDGVVLTSLNLMLKTPNSETSAWQDWLSFLIKNLKWILSMQSRKLNLKIQ